MSSASALNTLKNILFEEEKEKYTELSGSIKDLHNEMEASLNNREIPDSEIQQIIGHIMKVMPEKLGPAITKTLKVQIKESRDEVVQVLYPIMGQMIKSYIQKEIEILVEKIDNQFEKALSPEHILLRVKSFFGGVKYSEAVMKRTLAPQVEEVYIIEEDSGIVLGSYSKTKSVDEDMVAGMLTAIKSFVQDAFQKEEQHLEMIEYELYKIYIQQFNNFYIAIVFSGASSAKFKDAMNNAMLKMVKEEGGNIGSDLEDSAVSEKIKTHFSNISEYV